MTCLNSTGLGGKTLTPYLLRDCYFLTPRVTVAHSLWVKQAMAQTGQKPSEGLSVNLIGQPIKLEANYDG